MFQWIFQSKKVSYYINYTIAWPHETIKHTVIFYNNIAATQYDLAPT